MSQVFANSISGCRKLIDRNSSENGKSENVWEFLPFHFGFAVFFLFYSSGGGVSTWNEMIFIAFEHARFTWQYPDPS